MNSRQIGRLKTDTSIRWRRIDCVSAGSVRTASAPGTTLAQSSPRFARVAVETGQRDATPATEVSRSAAVPRSAQVSLPAVSRSRGLIEIVLPGGTSVRVDAYVDDRALRRVLDVLREP